MIRALLAACCAIAILDAEPTAPQKVIKLGVDLVSFGITVTDKKGTFIKGLTRDDFEIYENGKPQKIEYFLAGADDDPAAPPLHLGLLFDTSGSMEEDLAFARTSAIKFLNATTEAVDVTLVDFDTEVRVARYGPADYPRLIERIRRRKAEGYTALYDALGVYLGGASEQDGEKILVLYTDGGDTRSSMSYSDLTSAMKASDVTIYAIGYLEHQLSTARMDQRSKLQDIAGRTGGQAFFPSSIKELDGMYDKIRQEISARYHVGYASSDTRQDGAWRAVQIKLVRPDLKGARIRTRGGYFAPFRQTK